MSYFSAMNNPLVSVILPAYNAGTFLREAITSILNQQFTDFECILIDDGSTDDTAAIIRSFADPRIVYSKNERNRGLIFSLNKGIDMARGVYIARMDGDDISLPERLEKQVRYLEQNPEVPLLASVIELIDEQGNPLGYWNDDKKAVTPQQIRNRLPRYNCLAHPSVTGRAELFRKYKYNPKQQDGVEDYDFWLRMSADGLPIHKLNEVLLKYRVVTNSLSRQHKNVFWKTARIKKVFVRGQVKKGRFNLFVIRTLLSCVADFVKGVLKEIKKMTAKKAGS
jgi:glycosyltransferase involved in cell wall biosynthesis